MEANDKKLAFRTKQRERMASYLRLREEMSEREAIEVLLEGYPERQRARMRPYIENARLAAGFGRVLPVFAEMGVHEEVIDMSSNGVDAAMEILTTCMCRNACTELGLPEPLPVLCELDFEATRRAFPGLSVEALRRQADGAHVCVFVYSREERPDAGV